MLLIRETFPRKRERDFVGHEPRIEPLMPYAAASRRRRDGPRLHRAVADALLAADPMADRAARRDTCALGLKAVLAAEIDRWDWPYGLYPR